MQRSGVLVSLILAAAIGAPAAALAQKQEREAAAAPGQLAPVGEGSRVMRQDLKPGAYITPRHRKAVTDYLTRQRACLPGTVRQGDGCRASSDAPAWRIGAKLPGQAPTHAVPGGVLAALPKAPPGNRYVVYGGDILLIAAQSRMVVDAVPLAQ